MDFHARSRRRRLQQKLRKYLSKLVRVGGDRSRSSPSGGGFALDALEERLLLSTTLYWDTNGATPGLGGGGTWDTTTANWTTDPTGASTTQAWTTGSDAVFGGTAGTVTVSGTLSPASMTFNTDAYAVQSGTLTLPTGGTVTVSTGTSTISSVLSGSGDLTKSGSGTLILSGADTYTGGTTVSQGTLREGANNVLANTTAVTVSSGATFDLNGKTDTIGSMAGAGSVTLGSGTLTSGGDNTSTSYSGVMSGTGGLTKSGTGTLTLSGASTYTGPTTINAGVLSVSSLANGGSSSNIGQSTNAAANLVLGSGTLRYTGSTVSTDRNFTLTASTASAIDVTSGTTLTISGAAAATTGALTKVGAGTLKLGGANAYSGTTEVSSGTLVAASTGAMNPDSPMIVDSGATLDLGGYNSIVYSLSGGGAVTNNGGADAVLTVGKHDVTTGHTTFSGTMNDGAHKLGLTIARGAGGTDGYSGLWVSGNSTYSGPTSIEGGGSHTTELWQVASDALSPNSAYTVGTGSGLILQSSSGAIGSLAGGGFVAIYEANGDKGSTLTVGADNSNSTFSGSITQNTHPGPVLVKIGAGTLTLSGTNYYTGDTVIRGGTLSLSGDIHSSNVYTYPGATLSGTGSTGTVIAISSANLSLALSASVIHQNSATILSGNFDDSSAVSHTVTINWGDGTTGNPDVTTLTLASGVRNFVAPAHRFSGAGDDAISVTVTNGSVSQSATASVSVLQGTAAPAVITQSYHDSATSAQVLSVVMPMVDPGR